MNEPKRPATQVRFSMRTILVVSTLAAMIAALGREHPAVLFMLGFIGLVLLIHILLNMLGVYPKE